MIIGNLTTKTSSADWHATLLHHSLSKKREMVTGIGDKERRKFLERGITARNLFLLSELHHVLKGFEDAGISVIVLKGAALAERLYRNLGLRPFRDIDLLLRYKDLAPAEKVLSGLGYQRFSPSQRMAGYFSGEVTHIKRAGLAVMIELHWALCLPYAGLEVATSDGFWQRAEKAEVAGMETLILSPEDALFHACLHLFYHSGDKDNWLVSACDIAEMCDSNRFMIDWQVFLSRVFEFKARLPVRYSLKTAKQVFDSHIPTFVLERLGRYKPGKYEKFYSGLATGSGAPLAYFLSLSFRLKLYHLRVLLLPRGEWLLSHYHFGRPVYLPLLYPVMWGEITFKAARILFRLISHHREV